MHRWIEILLLLNLLVYCGSVKLSAMPNRSELSVANVFFAKYHQVEYTHMLCEMTPAKKSLRWCKKKEEKTKRKLFGFSKKILCWSHFDFVLFFEKTENCTIFLDSLWCHKHRKPIKTIINLGKKRHREDDEKNRNQWYRMMQCNLQIVKQ